MDKGEALNYQQEQNLAIKYSSQAINLQTELGLETDLANSLNNLALLYKSQGRYNEAETLYLQALEIRQQVFGDDHPNTVTVGKNLAHLRANLSNSPKAENCDSNHI